MRKLIIGLALGITATIPVAAGALLAQGEPPRSITLFNDEGFRGAPVKLSTDTANLQEVSAAEGFDGTANDYAYSLKTEGRWQVCMDAGFKTDCREVDGEVAVLGEQGGSISSVRYLGPSALANAAATPGQGTTGATATAATAPAWQPMRNVDLFGGDYREIAYAQPGNGWEQCKAECDADRQCKAFTYVAPGRTEHGECFLKNVVPEAASSDCCVSGIKGAPSAGNARGDAAINRVVRRMAGTAGDAAERRMNEKIDEGVNRVLDRVF
ncbi:PAN domain-containing protein [Sphingomonas sp. CJ99]